MADELRGRTFAFVQTLVRVILVLVLAVAPLLAAAFGQHQIEVTDAMTLTYNGAAIILLLVGLLAAILGVAAYRQMDDRRGVPLLADLRTAFRHEAVARPASAARPGQRLLPRVRGRRGRRQVHPGADARRVAAGQGPRGGVTFEPGATPVGQRLRTELLGCRTDGASLSPRAEALLFAADRAQHVATVIRPALERGAVVVTDRYVDSSVAYQGAGRELEPGEVARLSRWATDGLLPDLTVLLDLSPEVALQRVDTPTGSRVEPIDFHDRVRAHFLGLAAVAPASYLVVDATLAPEQMAAQLQAAAGADAAAEPP